MRWLWSLLLLFVSPSLVHAECLEVIMWDGGAGPYATPESACISIQPDHVSRFEGLYSCTGSSCLCGWRTKEGGYLITWGSVHKVITYEGDSCPGQNQCPAGERRYREVRFPSADSPMPDDPVDIDGCEAVAWWKTVSGCYVDADDPSMVICGVSYELTGNPSSGDMPPVQEPAPTGVTDSRMSFELETTSTPSTVTNPDGSTTTTVVEEKTVENPPAAVITETDTSVSFVQTSDTGYDKVTTTTTTTTYPDGTQVVVTEIVRERHTVPTSHTVISKTTGSYSQTVTPGSTQTGTTTITEHIDSDGNVTNRTVVNHGGGGQGAGGVAPGDQEPQFTCGGPGQPPCRVEFDESDMPDDPGGDQFSGLLDGTGIDSLIDGLASPPTMPSINPLPDLPDGGGVCQTVTLRWRSWSLTFPDAEQCAKLHQMQEYLAWALYILTVYGIFAMVTKKES